MALAFDLRRPVVKRFPNTARAHLVHGIEVCSVVSSFVFLFALVARVI
ncbi:hypothetical protein [Rhizobium mayense]|uniref:Uncharacterized protein n=1 Tax=Rhizobium mayense TaxID=1312184 RepID=A0ABT7JNT6_9HYPH|nr:hypothetical protein [Rhizobium mayense]MDL2398007.1 hypothetical protein [Rhizobium mayense]